jgi:hypothetical protein
MLGGDAAIRTFLQTAASSGRLFFSPNPAASTIRHIE